MSINAVNSVNFTGQRVTTQKGNEYKKFTAGKYVGLGAEVALTVGTGAFLFKKKSMKIKKLFLNTFEFGLKLASRKKNMNEVLFDIGLERTEYRQLRHKIISTQLKVLPPLCIIGSAVKGWGIGALINKFVNKRRAKKADAQN